MTQQVHSLRRYGPALTLSVAIWSTAPILGLARDALFERFSQDAVRLLAIVLGGLLVLVLAFAVGWILREVRRSTLRRSGWRWLGLGVALALLWFQVQGFRIGIPASDVAEKVHIVEYGLLAFLLYRGARRAPRFLGISRGSPGDAGIVLVPLFGAALAGIVDESVQGFFQLRTGDIRDVALNALAGLTGLVLTLTVSPPTSWRRLESPRRGLGWLVATTVLALGLFFSEAHLGHEIHHPEVGRFVSWFEEEELLRLQNERGSRWATDPPTLNPWHPEDYYLTEAAWHANHRNASIESGDLWMAVQANRLLETYYEPFLDLESFRGSGRHRWNDSYRDRFYAEHPAMPGIYLSPVLRSRLETRIPRGLWLTATVIVAALSYRLTRGRQRLEGPR
ncbi:MAG: VanZ family protein [Thermoanaerobaculia bacterium]|nr:VanZ family protein [Thermoanaerobaculia bacterium]